MKDYIKSKYFLTRLIVFILIVFVFNSSFGIEIIDPTNINWIMSARHDWGTHHLGWAFYRNEPWTFPLGEMETVNYPIGTNVGFFDNIPGMCILLKVFAPILPENFQFLGFWLLFCQLMAAHFTIKILNLYNVKTILVILATVLIACNPVLIYRGIHAALSAHFLIIASIYFYLKPATALTVKSINRSQLYIFMASALINPYLCFMIAGFNLILPIKHYVYDKLLSLKQVILYPVISLLSVLIIWILIGMITFGNNSALEVSNSYSLYGFNLNSLINSGGFSRYFPAMPYVTYHQYEGYLYTGLGMLLLIVLSLLYFFISGKKSFFQKDKKYLLPLFIFIIAATLFAISNRVTYNDHILFEYWMPGILLKLGNTFRACGRVIWIPYYVTLLFFMLVFIKSKVATWVKAVLLALFIFLQGYDLASLYIRESLPYGDYDSPLNEAKWNAVIPSFDAMITYPPHNNHLLNQMDYQDLSFMALKNHKPISMGYTAREDNINKKKYLDSLSVILEEGYYEPQELYITTPENLYIFGTLIHNQSLKADYLDGYYILYDSNKAKDIQYTKTNIETHKADSVVNYYSTNKILKVLDTLPAESDAIKYNIEKASVGNNSIIIKGWAFLKDEVSNKGDSVFVTVTDGTKMYIDKSAQVKRADLTSAFSKEYLEDSGFTSVIFTDGFTQKDVTIGIAIKKASGDWFFTRYKKSSEIEQTTEPKEMHQLPEKDNQIGNIDEYNIGRGKITISGWSCFRNMDPTDTDITIVFVGDKKNYGVVTTKTIRDDITKAYNTDGYNYDYTGFSVKVRKGSLPKGKYKVAIYLKSKNGKESAMVTDKELVIK